MFGLGFWEIVVILGLALIFIGPQKLPEIAKMLGKGFREFRSVSNDLKGAFDVNGMNSRPTHPARDQFNDDMDFDAETIDTRKPDTSKPETQQQENSQSIDPELNEEDSRNPKTDEHSEESGE